jgi:hypothetical protein
VKSASPAIDHAGRDDPFTRSLCAPQEIYRHLDARISTITESHQGGRPMDVVYLALVVVFWLSMAGMARGCALLVGGAK